MASGDISRRRALQLLGAAAPAWLVGSHALRPPVPAAPVQADDALLDALVARAMAFFWEQAGATGLTLDRVHADGPDARRVASIGATGFGLTALCLMDARAVRPHEEIVRRVRSTLTHLLTDIPAIHGFFYHFVDGDTGARSAGSEVSSVDTALLMCGVLTCRAHFVDPEIQRLAARLFAQVDWPWMQNGAETFSHGWTPEHGFLEARWDSYSEATLLYLLALGSPSHPVAPTAWSAWTRPTMTYQGLTYIFGGAPLFVHQFAHAWFDFRRRRDAYADHFANSTIATEAHRRFCLSLASQFPDYSETLWGISTSDSVRAQADWGGPPATGPIDGTVVPAAAAGSVAFLRDPALRVLRHMQATFGRAWTRYGFVNAFNPLTDWYDTDVVANDLGITLLMVENARSAFVWTTFMANPEVGTALERAGFRRSATDFWRD